MKTRFLGRAFLAMLAVSAIVSCRAEPPAQLLNGLKAAREHAGLRPVMDTWRISKFDADEIAWSYPVKFEAKKVAYEKDRPIWESDYFYSGRSFVSRDGDGTIVEQLTLHYDYKTGLCAVRLITDNPKLDAMVKGEVEQSGVKLEKAIAIARGILEKWGTKNADVTTIRTSP